VNHDFASDIAALACALVADGSFQTLRQTNIMISFHHAEVCIQDVSALA
jgi:hypothetical protein